MYIDTHCHVLHDYYDDIDAIITNCIPQNGALGYFWELFFAQILVRVARGLIFQHFFAIMQKDKLFETKLS